MMLRDDLSTYIPVRHRTPSDLSLLLHPYCASQILFGPSLILVIALLYFLEDYFFTYLPAKRNPQGRSGPLCCCQTTHVLQSCVAYRSDCGNCRQRIRRRSRHGFCFFLAPAPSAAGRTAEGQVEEASSRRRSRSAARAHSDHVSG